MTTHLKPDPVKMDTKLAEKYIKDNEGIWTELETGKIYRPVSSIPVSEKHEDVRLNFLDLAEKIDENAQLFSQLEHMRRGVIPIDVVNWDLKLLVQYLMYSVSAPIERSSVSFPGRIFTEDMPLANLGYFVHDLRISSEWKMEKIIFCDQKSAPVCTLFIQLWYQARLGSIDLRLLENPVAEKDMTAQCTGIISESADIDSAVDIFLGSTVEYPWKLSHLFVQENIFETFQKAMNAKCSKINDDTVTNCSKSYMFNDKTFLVDFFGDRKELKSKSRTYITVEAYRTTKELMSLVKLNKPNYISLWCSDISQANEIAFHIDTRAIWINDYAVFNGPPESSLTYYQTNLHACFVKDRVVFEAIKKQTDLTALSNIENSWIKFNQNERIKKMRECFNQFLIEENSKENKAFINDLQKSLLLVDLKSKVEIEKDTICVVDLKASGKPVHLTSKNSLQYIAAVLISMKNGTTVRHAFESGDSKIENINIAQLLELMENKQMPVTFVDDENPTFPVDFYNVKAIWTSFGTVFAN